MNVHPSEWGPPRCEHGNIILGCPHNDCEAQSLYLHEQDFAMQVWTDRQRQAVRELFGLPPEDM